MDDLNKKLFNFFKNSRFYVSLQIYILEKQEDKLKESTHLQRQSLT